MGCSPYCDGSASARHWVSLVQRTKVIDQTYIDALRRVITEVHGCKSVHAGSIWVKERLFDVVIWSGKIEIFGVYHPRAHRCFAWIRDRNHDALHAPARVFAILETAGMRTAEDAAKFARVGESAELVEQFSRWGRAD